MGNIHWGKVDEAVESGKDIDQRMCGTHACVAGWTCMLSTPLDEWRKVMGSPDGFNWRAEGQKRLGLTLEESAFLFGGTHAHGGGAQLEQVKGRVQVIRESRDKGIGIRRHPLYNTYEG